MRYLDRALQRWRFKVAKPWIQEDAEVLDIGCFQGEFLKDIAPKIRRGTGIDPLTQTATQENLTFLKFYFVDHLPFKDESFDVICLLAVLEHVENKSELIAECVRLLRKEGRVILTVPSPHVDGILELLARLSLIDGMSLDEHHHYDPSLLPGLFFNVGFNLLIHRRFQLGLNNLFVFIKTGSPKTAS